MSVEYTIYDPATTEIIVSGEFSPETMQLHAMQPGREFLLDVAGDPATQYVAGGELVSYTPEEVAARAAMPAGWVWQMPERIAVDARALADLVARHIAEVDRIADLARLAVVGDAARIKEYERAQVHAEQYRDSGWALDPAPSSVASWAAAKKWTARQACDDILAASARWLGALDGIRALRLSAKEDIRRASTNAAADAVLATFHATLTVAMQGVQ